MGLSHYSRAIDRPTLREEVLGLWLRTPCANRAAHSNHQTQDTGPTVNLSSWQLWSGRSTGRPTTRHLAKFASQEASWNAACVCAPSTPIIPAGR